MHLKLKNLCQPVPWTQIGWNIPALSCRNKKTDNLNIQNWCQRLYGITHLFTARLTGESVTRKLNTPFSHIYKEINNIDHLKTVQYPTEKPLTPTLDKNHLPKHFFRPSAPLNGTGTSWRHCSPMGWTVCAAALLYKHCSGTAWGMWQRP